MTNDDLAPLLTAEAVRRLREGQERIHQCVGLLDEDQLWHRPNGNLVSVGNLVMHLSGNVGQWINATLGGDADKRQRPREFDTLTMERRALLDRLDSTLVRALDVIAGLTQADLERTWNVQVYQESGLSIVVHVVEHFSYHVGQITLHTKLLRDVDTGYYAGLDLERKD
jgi:uncharacterized damage-inducible protein DinB